MAHLKGKNWQKKKKTKQASARAVVPQDVADVPVEIDESVEVLDTAEFRDWPSLPFEDEESDPVPDKDEFEKTRLYPGSKISKDESIALMYGFSLRQKLSKEGFSELISLIQMFVLEGASLPATHYLLEKQLAPDFSNVIKCMYCQNCETQVETTDNVCRKCNTVVDEHELLRLGKFYLQFDLRHVLNTMLEIPEVAKELYDNLNTRAESIGTGVYGDIVDGEAYKKLELKRNDLTLTMNTDGVCVFKSSSFSIWPIFVSLNELKYKLRRKHTKLVALWIGMKKPDFHTFLTPFVNQCNSLSKDELTWSFNGAVIKSNIKVVMVAADSVARCSLQGVKQFNGYYSCHYCYIKGEKYHMEGGGHKMIFPPSENNERSDESFFKDINTLQDLLTSKRKKSNKIVHVNGVQSVTPLVWFNSFNMVDGFPVDYMHTAILGVLRSLTGMLLDSKNKEEGYYLKKIAQEKLVERFLRCKVPYEVNRSTRHLNEIASWKANEWKTWLIVCIPILKGVLADTYVNHLSKFVVAMTLLWRDRVTEDDIQKADKLINQFIDDAGDLYGQKVYTFNMHLLLHFPQCVRNWGPVWAYSLFQFEDANGRLTQKISGTRQVGMQIAKKVCVQEKVLEISSSRVKNQQASALLNSMLENKKFYKNAIKCQNVTLLGSRKLYHLNDLECKMLDDHKIASSGIDKVWSYKHFIVRKKKFCSTKNDTARYCNSVACIDSKYYSISQILHVIHKSGKSEAIVFCYKLQIETWPGFEPTKTIFKVKGQLDTRNVFPCRLITSTKFCTIYDDDEKVTILSKLPNAVELE
jgi:hypothetical protein